MNLITFTPTKVWSAPTIAKISSGSVLCLAVIGCNPIASNTETTDTQVNTEASQQSANAMDHHNQSGADHAGMSHDDLNSDEPAEALGQDYSIYQVGGDWVDHRGETIPLDALTGKNQVVAMAYTSCQHTCPILVRSMKQMHDEMTPKARAQTEFLLATLDTKRDTPEVMKNFAQHNELGDNWRLIRSDEAGTRMLANTLNIKYQFADNGDINHSNLISVLDKEGRLVAQGVGIADSGIKPLIKYLNTHSN